MGAIISLGVLAIIAISTVWAILFKKRSLVRFIYVGTRAVLAFVLTMMLKRTLGSSLSVAKGVMGTMLGAENPLLLALSDSGVVTEILANLVGALVSPIIFLCTFFGLGLIMVAVRFILGIIFHFSKGPKLITRTVIGFVHGVIIAACILVPISSMSGVAAASLPSLNKTGMLPAQVYTSVEGVVSEIDGCAAVKTYRALGGKAIDGALMSFKVKVGEETFKATVDTEIPTILEFFSDLKTFAATPLVNYTEKETAAISNMGNSLTKSKVLAALVSDVIGNAAAAWDKNEAYMGMPKPSMDPTFDPILHKTISILGKDSANAEYLKEDFNTLATMISQIVSRLPKDNGEPKPEGEQQPAPTIKDAMLAKGVVKELLTTANANPRMRPLIPIITNVGLTMVTESVGIQADSVAAYNKLTADIANELKLNAALSGEERQQKMEAALKASLNSQGITNVGDSEVAIISMAVISNFNGVNGKAPTEVTAEDIAAFLNEMTSSVNTQSAANSPVLAGGEYGMSALASGQSKAQIAGKLIADICNVQKKSALSQAEKENQISQLIMNTSLFTGTGLSSDELNRVKQLVLRDAMRDAQSADEVLNIVSGFVADENNTAFENTTNKLLIDIEQFENAELSDQEMTAFIDGISLAFEQSSEVITSLGAQGSAETVTKLCGGIGTLLDTLAANEKIYGQTKSEKLMNAILKSSKMTGTIGLSYSDIQNMLATKKEKNVSYTAFLGSVSQTANTLTNIKNGSGINDDNIGALVDSLATENSGAVVATAITPEKIGELGFASQGNGENLESASNLLQDVFTNVSETDESKREQEVAGVKTLMVAITDANKPDNAGKPAFGTGEDSRLGMTSDEMVNSVLGSESVSKALNENKDTSNPFGMNLTENEKNELKASIVAKNSTATEEEKETLKSLASLFGVTF